MGKTNLKDQKLAKKAVDELFESASTTVVIHYSCESFYDRPQGTSPRVTSIAIRRLDSAQTTSFSIHQIAELHKADLSALEENYDIFEKEMLGSFYNFITHNERHKWLHWNMRDINYGFAALEHRYRVLGGIPTQIPDSQKYDLARILIDIYGSDYIKHPRLESLINKNEINKVAFMPGKDEAEAFNRHDYVALHQSTLRKVDIFATIISLHRNGILRTNATWWDKNGSSIRGAFEAITSHPLYIFVFGFGAGVAAYVSLIEPLILSKH